MPADVTYLGSRKRYDGTTIFQIGNTVFRKGQTVEGVPDEIVKQAKEQRYHDFQIDEKKPARGKGSGKVTSATEEE